MRLYIYITLLILSALTSAHIVVTSKDWNEYKERIIQKLEVGDDVKVHIAGKIEASLITPKVTLHNVYIQYNRNKEQKLSDLVSIGKIEVKPSLLSLLMFSLQPKSIALLDMKSSQKNLFNIINAKFTNSITDVTIKDGHISIEDDCIDIKKISIRKNKKFFGTIKIKNSDYDFSGEVNAEKKNLDINIESNLISLLFKGSRDQSKINGNLQLTINNSHGTINNLVKIVNFNLLSNFIPDESIKILSNVSIDENQLIINDLKLDSDTIQMNGKIHRDRKSNHTNVNANFSKVNLDAIQSSLEKKANVKDILECLKKVIPQNLNLDFDVKASSITYEKKILDNFHATVKFADGSAAAKMVLKLPGINNMFYLSGKASSNNILSEFNGNIQIEGNDFKSFVGCIFPSITVKENNKNQFTFYSKVHFSPRVVSVSDIKLLNNQELLQGSIRISYTKKHNMIDGGLNFHNFNADNYDVKDLSKVKWLKNFKYDVNIRTSINNLKSNNKKIKNVDYLLNIEKNRLVADNIKIYGKDFDANGSIKILIDKKYTKPLWNIDFTGKKFNANIIKLPNFIEKTGNLRNKMQLSQDNLDFLNAIENFDANIHINTENFNTKDNALKDFHLDASVGNNTVTIRQVGYSLGSGTVIFQGYLRADSVYTKFLISGLDIDKVSQTIGVNNITGPVSLSGTLKTQGKNFYEWARNSSGGVNFGAQKVTLSNIDLNSFVTNILNSQSKYEIAAFTDTEIYKNNTPLRNIKGKADINNGVCSTSLQFETDKASGSVSANLALYELTVDSILRLFFIPSNQSKPIHIDMHLGGPIWQPRINFDVDKIFNTLSNKNNY
ncbi:MAG: AsmA-like C-terminal region-containing protein [Wolbachia endosymbiont of Tyrophagus putrescentiae]|nr:AsmA-like C-terminal region-containing protein [Wolbachia endosymbiont of Tyrophagus putrescentiae]